MNNLCKFCGDSATLLCDFNIALVPFGQRVSFEQPKKSLGEKGLQAKPGTAFTTGSEPPITCDNPICHNCARRQGYMHITMTTGCHSDTIDWCPDHDGKTDIDAPVESEAEARARQVRSEFKMI